MLKKINLNRATYINFYVICLYRHDLLFLYSFGNSQIKLDSNLKIFSYHISKKIKKKLLFLINKLLN